MRHVKVELGAEGPEELKRVLDNLLELAKTDPQSVAHGCFIHYQHGKQESLIKISPFFQIYYYNLLGRPATEMVKNIINDFLKSQGNQQGSFNDVSRADILEKNQAGFLAADADKSRVMLSDAPITLAYAFERLNQASCHSRESALAST